MTRRTSAIFLHSIPLTVALLLTGVFAGSATQNAYEPPLLLPILSTIFVAGLPLAVALLALRSYVEQGTRVLVLFGIGLVAPAMGTLLAGWGLVANGPNFLVTVHNVGMLLGGACQLAAACLLVTGSPTRTPLTRNAALRVGLGGYAGSALLVMLVAALAAAGRTPLFFASPGGPTPLRQVVLSAAALCYAFGGVLLVGLYGRTGMAFFALYANALLLNATALGAAAVVEAPGDPLSWVGRGAQYAGSIYFVATLFVQTGPARREGTSLPGYLSELLRAHLDAQVRYRTGELLALNERLRKEIAEREHLDAELRASEERLRLAAEATGFGIFSYDLQSRSAHWSAEMLRLFGVPPGGDIVLDAGFVPLTVHPGDRDRVAALVASWTSPGATGIIDTEFRVRWPGGETRWLRARGRVTFESGPRSAAVRAHGIVQ
ncbi:MAG TPA: PAS domain-containing protein, partial [Spirochaetia bacterium]|nr:PAS domain-containing protein [Spirochaetia bacterium]